MARMRDAKGRFVAGPTSAVAVIGLDKALMKLNHDLRNIPLKSQQGMIAAGMIVQKNAQKLTPVEWGNLKASATTIWKTKKGEKQPRFMGDDADELAGEHQRIVSKEKADMKSSLIEPSVEVVFTAHYALYVHENMQAKHKGRGTAKFLELAVKNSLPEIVAAVKMEIQKKGKGKKKP